MAVAGSDRTPLNGRTTPGCSVLFLIPNQRGLGRVRVVSGEACARGRGRRVRGGSTHSTLVPLKGPDGKVPTFRTLGALMAPYRIAMRSP